MNCCYHEEKAATFVCVGCGKALCADCANVVSPPMCNSCIAECEANAKREMTKSILFGGVIAIACCILMQEVVGMFFFCIPFGWYALNKITPQMFLFLPLVGWGAYFGLKFILSAVIGWIAVAVKMYQWIRTISIANKVLR